MVWCKMALLLTKINTLINLSVLLVLDSISHTKANTEFCNGDVFEVACNSNEVIVINSARYGRMKIGRCVDRDYGHLGCSNDALQALDKTCSGKQSCSLFVSNKLRTDEQGACGAQLTGFAEINYTCREVMAIERGQCQAGALEVTSKHSLISSSSIKEACSSTGHLKIMAQAGQTLNVSLWNFKAENKQIYGTINDQMSSGTIQLTGSNRFQNIYASVGNVIEVNLHRFNTEDANFLLQVEVIGCADMTPPAGAWMTRQDDVMEVGCHSGSKAWTLRCEKNQWIGILGYCGINKNKPNEAGEKRDVDSGGQNLSLNVLLFGVCSLVILISACIFLAGALLLKRKIVGNNTKAVNHTLPLLGENGCGAPPGYLFFSDRRLAPEQFQQNTLPQADGSILVKSGDYKSLQMTQCKSGVSQEGDGVCQATRRRMDYSQYRNSSQPDKSGDSVKYYVLED